MVVKKKAAPTKKKAAPKRSKRAPKKAVPKKKITTRKESTTKVKSSAESDLDLDYEEYLELYAEDNDGGTRPKLTKRKFGELSDEMMGLVNWENIERLPPEEKRRMKELEYLLLA